MFKPWAVFDSAWDISYTFLTSYGIKALLLDIDNTLSVHSDSEPFPEALPWLESLRILGIRVILVSNNREQRIKPFAKLLNLPYVTDAAKPLPIGYKAALKALGLKKSEVCAVGDQIFTDVLGANLYGIKSVFVYPKVPELSRAFRFKRALERALLPARSRIGKR